MFDTFEHTRLSHFDHIFFAIKSSRRKVHEMTPAFFSICCGTASRVLIKKTRLSWSERPWVMGGGWCGILGISFPYRLWWFDSSPPFAEEATPTTPIRRLGDRGLSKDRGHQLGGGMRLPGSCDPSHPINLHSEKAV